MFMRMLKWPLMTIMSLWKKDKPKKGPRRQLIVYLSHSCPPCHRYRVCLLNYYANGGEVMDVHFRTPYDDYPEYVRDEVGCCPTFIIKKEGKEVSRVEGKLSKKGFMTFIGQ